MKDDTVFQDPTESSFPQITDGQYLLQLQRLEDAEPGQFGPRVRWVFLMWNASTREQVCWENGEPYEWWRMTSPKTGQRSTARKYMEALLGRDLTTDDTGEALAKAVVGRTALAMVATNDEGWAEIVSIKPYTKGSAQAQATPEPAPVPVAGGPMPAEVGDDLPF